MARKSSSTPSPVLALVLNNLAPIVSANSYQTRRQARDFDTDRWVRCVRRMSVARSCTTNDKLSSTDVLGFGLLYTNAPTSLALWPTDT